MIPRCMVLLWLAAALPAVGETWRFERDGVLGTTFTLTVTGVSEARAGALASAVLAEIERLDGILSTWRDDSEIAALNRGGRADSVSPELLDVLRACEHWRERTRNAFSCRLGALLAVWKAAAETGNLPDRGRLRAQAREIGAAELQVNGVVVELAGVIIAPDGLAKGYIIDRALALARELAPEVSGLQIDIGGDGAYFGHRGTGEPWRVAVGQPGVDGDDYLGLVALSGQAVAFSGHNRRYWEIGGRRLSHILDPQSGWPPGFAPAAVVVAPDTVTADALATALTVMPMRRALALVDELPEVEALIISEGGTAFASSGWYGLLAADGIYDPAWGEGRRFTIEYGIPEHRVTQYRRPYAALWIIDENRELVRQLLVHGRSSRWLREVPTWWRRHGRRDDTVIDGLAQPTPAPGQHMLAWDGRDARGRAVKPGGYELHIEAAREHGGRELLVVPFELDGTPFEVLAEGEEELGSIRVWFE